MYIRVSKFHRLYADDWMFLFAVGFLIAGTTMVFLTLPYNQTEVNVGAGVEAPPPDFAHQLDFDVKFQDAASLLVNASIFSVKFSFLLFFRRLLERTGKLQRYWWFTFIITVPSAIVCMCTEFIACPAFGDRIMGKSNSVGKDRPHTAYRCVPPNRNVRIRRCGQEAGSHPVHGGHAGHLHRSPT